MRLDQVEEINGRRETVVSSRYALDSDDGYVFLTHRRSRRDEDEQDDCCPCPSRSRLPCRYHCRSDRDASILSC